MSEPRENESAVLLYMLVPPTHPIAIMSYPDNTQRQGRPPALDLSQAETLVGASTFAEPSVFRAESLPGGRVRYHVSVRLIARDPAAVQQGIENARAQAAASRPEAAMTFDLDPDDLEGRFGPAVARAIRAGQQEQTFPDLEGHSWRLAIKDDRFGYTFSWP